MILDPQKDSAAFWKMARAMAVYSARAYTSDVVTDPATDASALITLDDDGDIIVAFKGSSRPIDFIVDAEFEFRDFGYSAAANPPRVHRGFFGDSLAIGMAVLNQVKTYLSLKPSAKIFITGHSLGGALAILCAFEFSRQGLPVAAVFTLGQPRVGNRNFCDMYDRSLKGITFRIVNENDIVPRAPGLLSGYRHCGTEIFLEPPPYGSWCINPGGWYKFLNDSFGLWGAFTRLEDVLFREHFIAAYQERIKNL